MTQRLLPSAEAIVEEVISHNPDLDVNELHERTYVLLDSYRERYYVRRVDELLSSLEIDDTSRRIVKEALLTPIEARGRLYSNFMVEVSRRMSQSVQPVSGKIAEFCAEIELKRAGLERDHHYALRRKRTDFTLYHPSERRATSNHRVEVKNVKMRERAARGLAFDGDSLFGFFNDPGEFTTGQIELIEQTCLETGGYVYIPPETLDTITAERLEPPSERLRPNTRFGSDMAAFVRTGSIPEN